MACVAVPFCLVAVCENPALSPHVAARIRSRWAWLWAPLLPGARRGMLFVAVLATSSLVTSCLLSRTLADAWVLVAAWSYILSYTAVGAFIRVRLPATPQGSARALLLLVLFVVFANFAPVLVRGLTDPMHHGPDWTLMLLPSAVLTLRAVGDHDTAGAIPVLVLLPITVLVVVAMLPPAVREVMEARRRNLARRAQRPALAPAPSS